MSYLHTLLLTGWLLLSLSGGAQKISSPPLHAGGGCYLPPSTSFETFLRPYVFSDRLRPKELTYAINYMPADTSLGGLACATWPEEAKAAFEYGVAIWSDVLQGSQRIDVDACYSFDMLAGTLGSAGAVNLRGLGPVFGEDVVFFPDPLAEELVRGDIPGADINVFINGNFSPNFYYGTDARPASNQIDFVTLTVHEMGHGLGFSGSARYDNGAGPPECDGVAGNGCLGYEVFFNDGSGPHRVYTAYDLFADLGTDGSPMTSLTPNPGPEIGAALTGQLGGLDFDESNHATFAGGTERQALYTPASYRAGSSFSHFGNPAEVMYYELRYGSANHDVGQAARVLQNIGWPQAMAAVLPVELLAFSGQADKRGVALAWETATEVNNETFEIEASRNGQAFTQIGALPGRGTTSEPTTYAFLDEAPAPGTNLYRLRQLDHDGRVTYSDYIGVDFAVATPSVGAAYPNPARGGTVYLDYRRPDARRVTSTLHDTAGRLLRRRETELPAGLSRLSVDLTGLPRGLYLLRLDDGGEPLYRRVVLE